MIDGAHVLTPGVLRFGMAGLRDLRARDRRRPSSGTSGPGQQGDAMQRGYDQAYEDRLFERDRLAGRRLPALRDRPLHRRARLVRRDLGEQLPLRPAHARSSRSAASTRASRCRAAATPTSSCTSASARRPTSPSSTILGEGSFHQVHGGTTTNEADADERRRRIVGYGEHYARAPRPALPRAGQADPLRRHHAAASPRRTQARAGMHRRRRSRAGAAATPTALPEHAARRSPRSCATAFIDAFWHSLAWRHTTWLGRPVDRRRRPTCSRTRS